MNQTILVNTNIDKGTKLGDVGNDAWYHHSYLNILKLMDVVREWELFNLASWVESWLIQFFHDISKRWQAYSVWYIVLYVDSLKPFFVSDKLLNGASAVSSHTLHYVVALWVYGAIVQRILGVRNAQETCTLCVGISSKTRYLLELRTRCEVAILATIFDDVLCQGRTKTADVSKQLLTGGIHVYTNKVNAVLHRLVQTLLEFCLVYIVLILSYANALGINLHKLSQRVHQSSSYRDSTSNRNVLVRELVACYLRCRIYRSSILANHVDRLLVVALREYLI